MAWWRGGFAGCQYGSAGRGAWLVMAYSCNSGDGVRDRRCAMLRVAAGRAAGGQREM